MFDQVSRGRTLGGLMAVMSGAGVAALTICAGLLGWMLLAEPATAPPVTYTRFIPEDQATVGGIALEPLHRELWTRWSVARTRAERRAAAEAITAALSSDPPLADIADALMQSAEQGDLSTAADAAVVYDAALQARDMPWAVQVGAARTPYVKTYWVVARPTVRLADRTAEVRYGLRADNLNVVEGWLGVAEDIGGAIVVVDRVEDFAFDVLWPLLAGGSPLSEALRAEAAAHLSPDALSALVRIAPARAAMVDARKAVEARRHTCGAGFILRFGWSGLDDLAALRGWARSYRGDPCPGLTDAEATALIRGTLQIRGEPELPEALEALVAWAARHVAVHEARHRVDHEDWGFGTPPPCSGCGTLDDDARIEASAYLSALASEEALVAAIQACTVLEAVPGGRAVRALRALFAALELSCDAPPPADLAARSQALAREWFDRDEEVGLGDELPRSLPLEIGPHLP